MRERSLPDTSARLNRDCLAVTLDRAALHAHIDKDSGTPGLHRRLLLGQPNLFASVAVFVSRAVLERIRGLIRAVEAVAGLASYQREALRDAPAIASLRFGPRGVCFGYDVHLDADGPKLIEINTNAGGAFLNGALARSQQGSCAELARRSGGAPDGRELARAQVAMFEEEWRTQRRTAPLRTIAIVDERPEEQMLYADFLLCQGMLRRAGYDARVLPPEALVEKSGALFDRETPIDLVYNRLTDFYLERASNAPIRRAYVAGGVVVTPHPHAHALYADKRRLALLSDGSWLADRGVSQDACAALHAGVPRTEVVDARSRDRLFRARDALFFKPAGGYGSQAVRRGGDLDEATWGEMRDGEHVAQELVAPGERTIVVEGAPVAFKVDLRAYAYAGAVQLLGARLYRGVATNLRTVGGGFAPVFVEGESPVNLPLQCAEPCGLKDE